MKKISTALLFVFLTAQSVSAQKYIEVLKLKDGTKIEGIILNQTSNTVTIRDAKGNLNTFAISEVDSSFKQQVSDPNTPNAFLIPSPQKTPTNTVVKRGYTGEAGITSGIPMGNSSGYIGLHTVHGFTYNRLFLGAGINFNAFYFGSYKVDDWYVPIYAKIRYNLGKNSNSVRPFVDGRLGYAVIQNTGLYWGASAGISMAFNETHAFSLGLGYEQQFTNQVTMVDNKNIYLKTFALRLTVEF